MYNPLSTYRIQFNKDFTFQSFQSHLDYLALLGIGTLYASPVFPAVPQSMHGYDVTNPYGINPEIGTEMELANILNLLETKNIGWLQDIVPNHMAFHMINPWIWDIMEKGQQSGYARYFDIDFEHPGFRGKLMMPFLGKTADEAIDQKEIKFLWENGQFVFSYYDSRFPVNVETIRFIFRENATLVPGYAEIDSMLFGSGWKQKLESLYQEDHFFKAFTDHLIGSVNDDPDRIKELLARQHYLLCFWQDTEKQLNYRRFFTINGLICLRMEEQEVFDAYHSFIGKMISEKKFQGLRVDHIDGLREPTTYFERLRSLAEEDTYMVVEKILERGEELAGEWPLQGTSGYDFLAMVNNLFTYSKNYSVLRKYYEELTGMREDPEDIIYQKKKMILTQSMNGDWDNLCRMFNNAGLVTYGKDPEVTPETMKEAIGEFLLACPWYKLYSHYFPVSGEDRTLLKMIFRNAGERFPFLSKPLKVLHNLFVDQSAMTEEKKTSTLQFFLRCMQFTGPLMAKGVEDTVMYYYNCFIAHNEVGDSPQAAGMSIDAFHESMQLRQKKIPMTMNATSTHDTKRGEDVRARLNVISELPEEWTGMVNRWTEHNKAFRVTVAGAEVPSANEEYFIYQTLIGIFPFDGKINGELEKRINEYLVKALREAKINSDWNRPNEEYEKAVISFISGILQPAAGFLDLFYPFQRKIASYGIYNSLTQLVLKVFCPGIPDFYQGTELWDFSLVDPDNRRPVNFHLREKTLREMIREQQEDPENFFRNLYDNRENGSLKLWMTHQLMKERSLHPDLFVRGQYVPLSVVGKYREHVLAFARNYLNTWYVVVVPLYLALLGRKRETNGYPGEINWEDTSVLLPETAPEKWTLSGEGKRFQGRGQILVSNLLEYPCPVFLKGIKEESRRKAGILLHITSLPGKYGTGDMGPEAWQFVDYLYEGGQSFWQILPINPVEEGSDYSPYSTFSAFAGNLILISPDLLVKNRLVNEDDLHSVRFASTFRSDFKKAEAFRRRLLNEAYTTFINQSRFYLHKKFEEFIRQERYWIDDYALYIQLKREFSGKPWNEWPVPLRDRERNALSDYKKKYAQEMDREKFFQFLFSEQWKSLKEYANEKGVRIIGDMSFYVSYDSVEVWQNPVLFKLDDQKRMISVAGVPPDYFSKTGQLWNMPVYHWVNMKQDNYTWWRNRIRKNLEYCDLVRFDHFRGFSAFWEVPAGEKTAVKGQWMEAPGHDFFRQIETDFPNMPFIAEDLGDIDDKVYRLRDRFSFPGMRVLQFAFGKEMPKSVHIPHNHSFNSIVYTGTHDNNTIKGWFRKELPKDFRNQVDEYTHMILRNSFVHREFIRMAYGSVARIAIIPMQDVLGLDSGARLNDPSSPRGNWNWKLKSRDINPEDAKKLRKLVELYGR